MKWSLNNSAQQGSEGDPLKGREEEGNTRCTILPLDKCCFQGGPNPILQCQSELEQSTQMSFMNPEQLLELC